MSELEWSGPGDETEKSCDNCVTNEIPCPYKQFFPPFISHCVSWQKIVAIPNGAALYPTEIAREEGYNQAMNDIDDWWADNTHVQLGQTKFYVDLRDVLRDKKKSRFHSELPKPDLSEFTRKDYDEVMEVIRAYAPLDSLTKAQECCLKSLSLVAEAYESKLDLMNVKTEELLEEIRIRINADSDYTLEDMG